MEGRWVEDDPASLLRNRREQVKDGGARPQSTAKLQDSLGTGMDGDSAGDTLIKPCLAGSKFQLQFLCCWCSFGDHPSAFSRK